MYTMMSTRFLLSNTTMTETVELFHCIQLPESKQKGVKITGFTVLSTWKYFIFAGSTVQLFS